MNILEDLGSPTEVWDYFYKITKIPRCSQNEDQIRNFIKTEAENFGFSTEIDKAKNIVVRIRSDSNTREKKSRIILQCHMDMVCEKERNSQHDFSKDPITLKIIKLKDEKWLTADGTTLGADNGIGIAYQLAIMKKIYNGELNFGLLDLDLLFTYSEEHLALGATNIDRKLISGKYLINLDNEEEDIFIIGSAGIIVSKCEVKINRKLLIQDVENLIPVHISIAGLIGGHSGVDIHKGRANAIKLLAQILWKTNQKTKIYLNAIEGGNVVNSIPRESQTMVFINSKDYNSILNEIKESSLEFERNFNDIEPNLSISVNRKDDFKNFLVFPDNITNTLLDLLYVYPSGPISFHPRDKELVHTSTNLGVLKSTEDQIIIELCHRSMSNYGLDCIDDKINVLFRNFNPDWELRQLDKGPSWTPDYKLNIVKVAKKTYRELYNKDIQIQALHAGCECCLFKEYYPDMEMIAIGPTIEEAHSPDERLKIKSVERIWCFIIALLKNLS